MEGWLQFLKEQGPATCFAVVVLWWFHKHAWPTLLRRVDVADRQRDQMVNAIDRNTAATSELSHRMTEVSSAVTELRADVTRQRKATRKQR